MGERVKVDVGSLSNEISSANSCLQKRIEGAQACINALQKYCGESQLKGAAYSNSKEFYLNTYIPLLNQVICVCSEFIAKNNSVLPAFSRHVPNTRGFAADTEVIEEEIRRLERENADYRWKIKEAMYRLTPEYSGIIQWYRGRIRINENSMIPPLRKIVDGLRAFNSECASIYNEIGQLLGNLSSTVKGMDSKSVWNSASKRYFIPENVKNGISMVTFGLLSQLGESQEKDMKIINTLFPDWNRRLAEAINSCPAGASQTVSDEMVIRFPNGSSITYEISATVNSSSVSVMDVNMNLIDQATTLNCGEYSFAENGVMIPVLSNEIGKTKVTTSFGLEIDKHSGLPVMKISNSTTTKEHNFSGSFVITARNPLHMPKPVPEAVPVPEVVPVEEPKPDPWYKRGWNWLCDGVKTVGGFIVEHPVESAAIAVMSVGALIEPTPFGEAAVGGYITYAVAR